MVLENLRLRKDVLQNALQLPTDYDIASGGVRELRLTIPWTRILARSQPIIQALFRSIEIVVVPVDRSETPPSSRDRSASADQPPSSQPSDQKVSVVCTCMSPCSNDSAFGGALTCLYECPFYPSFRT